LRRGRNEALKILQISSAGGFGGGEKHFVGLARGLAERGHEVYFALDPESPLGAALGLDIAGEARPKNLARALRRNRLNLSAVRPLARFMCEREIEIAHAHVGRDYPIAAAAARLSKGARLVLTRHVMFSLNPLHKVTLANVSRVIAVSEAAARALRRQKIFPPSKIRVVHNGVDAAAWAEAERRARSAQRTEGRPTPPDVPAPLRVGTVGELSEVKDQETFLRAASLVAQAQGDGVEFVLVGGEASAEYRARLERLAAEGGLEGRAHMLGRREDVAEILPSFDVFVSTSQSEAFGLAVLEAMACGVPVVATATEGAREIVEDGATGTLVPVGDAEAVAAAVSALLADAALREAYGRSARLAAQTRFSLERMIEETESIYQEALQEGVAGSQ
jgi:glycosyltransferase involved in cell wall biosynthesis